MSQIPPTVDWSCPASLAQHVDQLCDVFEAAWKTEQRPRIEEYLGGIPEPGHSVLLRKLLALEVAYRRREGERPHPDEYRLRFPDYVEEVGALIREAAVGLRGRYEILDRLPSGGMGVVYKARHIKLNLLVAIKMVRAGQFASKDELERFYREARAVARLGHPHIVRVYDCGEHEGVPYFTMEFVSGGSLAEQIAGKPQPPQQAGELLEILARTMHFVHESARVIHRDLKPANVLVTEQGIPKIADFGLVKSLDQETNQTRTGAIMGTASYMAPEQAAGKVREIGPAVDIYGLGAILYEVLTGEPPFRAESWERTIHKVLCDEPVPPTQLRAEVPRELEAICLKCLEKEPGQRYASAAALADDLRRFLAGQLVSSRGTFTGWLWSEKWARGAGYEVLGLLGCSPLAITYKARQVSLNRVVVLKLLLGNAGFEPEKLARFRAEAEALANVNHPNIVQVYDYGEQNGRAYYSMEYFDDDDNLSEKIRGRLLSVERATELVYPIARAIHYAHQRELIHCHLRPEAVALVADETPKILSFNFCKVRGGERYESDPTWVAMAASDYMAPEQAESWTRDAGPATDVYGLGGVLYTLLTGQSPISETGVKGIRARIRDEEPVPPSHLRPGVPQELDAICLKCLRKSPHQRYASAAALADDLRRFLGKGQSFDQA